MALWMRFEAEGEARFGTVDGDEIAEHEGDLFAEPRPTGRRFRLDRVKVLIPCRPSKMIGLWNNFHERARAENLHQPAHPLYFLKPPNSYAAHGEPIRRPAGCNGPIVFEGELGIVIGRRCSQASSDEARRAIFGYTCVNDVTARELLRQDPAFVHWTRAKGFDTFGVFGPTIATGIDPMALRVCAKVAGEERQDYPVADMIFGPYEIVSRLSMDMTLEPGDLVACGTSVGAGPMKDGEPVEVIIEGVGHLANVFG